MSSNYNETNLDQLNNEEFILQFLNDQQYEQINLDQQAYGQLSERNQLVSNQLSTSQLGNQFNQLVSNQESTNHSNQLNTSQLDTSQLNTNLNNNQQLNNSQQLNNNQQLNSNQQLNNNGYLNDNYTNQLRPPTLNNGERDAVYQTTYSMFEMAQMETDQFNDLFNDNFDLFDQQQFASNQSKRNDDLYNNQTNYNELDRLFDKSLP